MRKNGAVTLLPGKEYTEDQVFEGVEDQIKEIAPASLSEAEFRDGVKKFLEFSRGQGKGVSGESQKAEQEFGRLEPGLVLMRQFLDGLGISGLKTIKKGERVVFSTRPTSWQQGWPVDGAAQVKWLNEICDVKNPLIDAVNSEKIRFYSRGMTSNISTLYGGTAEPATAMRMTVERDSEYLRLVFGIFRADGVQIAQFWQLIGLGWAYWGQGNEDEEPPLKGELKLSEEDLTDLENVRKVYGWGSSSDQPVKADWEYFAGVDARNPLSGTISKFLDFGCDASGNELVMEISGYPGFLEYQLPFLADRCEYLFDGARGGLVVKEPDYYDVISRKDNLPKSAIAGLARTALRKGSIDFDDLANSVKGLNRYQVVSLMRVVQRVTNSDYSMSVYEGNEWEVFLLMSYAKLSPSQRALARSTGVQIPVNQGDDHLSGDLREQLGSEKLWARFPDYSFGAGDMTRPGIYARHGEPVDFDHWNYESTEYLARPACWPGAMTFKVSREGSVETLELGLRFGVVDGGSHEISMNVSPIKN